MISMFENAYKQQPNNEELGAQTFFANVRTGNWKTAQQVRSKTFASQRSTLMVLGTGGHKNAQAVSR